MDNVLIGCGQITWGRTIPEDQVLAEIALAGYAGAPANPGDDPTATAERFARHGLTPAPAYLGAPLWDAAELPAILERATTLARGARALGCTELYVAPNLTPERRAVAGHVRSEDALPEAGFRQCAESLNRIGEVTLREGVSACFHNHVGSPIETREEIDRLFALIDRGLVFQGPDLGHLAWAGGDAVQFCRDYAASIKTLHVKDIDPAVRARGVAAGWDYATFSAEGVFVELGEGMVDLRGSLAALADAGFAGWLIVETDVTRKATPLESATISRAYLRDLGV